MALQNGQIEILLELIIKLTITLLKTKLTQQSS